MTMELSAVAKRLSFTDLRHVRNIESRLLTTISVLEATAVTLREILGVIADHKGRGPPSGGTRSFVEDETMLRNLARRCDSFILSATEVQRRNDKLIELVCIRAAFVNPS